MKLILDYNTWRCGGDSVITKYDVNDNASFSKIDNPNSLGEGTTTLLNDQGYMCCLGQFSPQLNNAVRMRDMQGLAEPHEIGQEVSLLCTETISDYDGYDEFTDTCLSTSAIEINDSTNTTPLEKIVLLKELFSKADCEIEVINLP